MAPWPTGEGSWKTDHAPRVLAALREYLAALRASRNRVSYFSLPEYGREFVAAMSAMTPAGELFSVEDDLTFRNLADQVNGVMERLSGPKFT